ncbi:NAD-dependent deacylase [Apibacter raozihei]|uniref:SIR2 family NAD-dependent protein deacylase n=1 Tax=Apibacter raozihei TaxID=2500547 RepID=UPI000FE426B9|nr:Sir2 family NAD-dependent protein deacetylase [Apibacter raozihei]
MKNLVVLTGAGISAESGISTYRDLDGLWGNYNPKEVASIKSWEREPQKMLDFYNLCRNKLKDIQPNKAHKLVKDLENTLSVQVITQNVDDLHEKAGSTNVLHLHGKLTEMRSEKNPDLVSIFDKDLVIGDLASDGFQLRPNVVWFGEEVPMIEEAKKKVESADILLIVGTSLQVYPAAFLVFYARKGIPVYLIDPNPEEETLESVNYIRKSASEGMKEFLEHVLKTVI